MRARNIKPGFFKNEQLVQLPEAVRLLFIGLWCLADRRGRLEDRPARIKMEIYPCDQHEISTMLDLLQHHAFILRYEAKGNRYIQIINFEKHQYPHIREQDSTIPAPYKPGAGTRQARLNPSSLNPESPLLNPHAPGQPGVFDFESVWQGYPRKIGKEAAHRHFKAQVKSPEDFAALERALVNFKAELKKNETEQKYIPHGSTWFCSQWRDYAIGETTNGTNDGQSPVSYAAIARAKREAEKVRAVASPRSLSSGSGDMRDIQAETVSSGGVRHDDS